MSNSLVQVFNEEINMGHLLLLPGLPRPYRRFIFFYFLKSENPALRGAQSSPSISRQDFFPSQ